LSGLDVHVGGADAEPIAAGAPGVTVRGRVPDALEFLQTARAIAVPSVSGGGVQIKTLDAIASGRPVVATSVALRGIDDPPATVRVADDPAGFAAALAAAAAAPPDPAAEREAQAWVGARGQAFTEAVAGALDDLRSPAHVPSAA
jgi:polysaccharide biosynthesis protein PslH